MSIENTGERKVRPTHPGEMLREDFLPDYGLTAAGIAKALGVSRQSVNELLRERRAVSPKMALRLARLFGNTPEFWLNAQRAVEPDWTYLAYADAREAWTGALPDFPDLTIRIDAAAWQGSLCCGA
jgi:antitoxin HigA-1